MSLQLVNYSADKTYVIEVYSRNKSTTMDENLIFIIFKCCVLECTLYGCDW